MKQIIMTTILSLIFTTQVKGTECQIMKTVNTEVDFQGDLYKQEMIHTILVQLKKIMELKFKLAGVLEENRSVYGQYVSLSERKLELSEVIEHYERQRSAIITKYNEAVRSLNPEHRARILRRILEQLKLDKEQDLARVDRELNTLYAQRSTVEKQYLEASRKWSPYKKYLDQIQELESSLMATLNFLKDVEEIEAGARDRLLALAQHLGAAPSPLDESYSALDECLEIDQAAEGLL